MKLNELKEIIKAITKDVLAEVKFDPRVLSDPMRFSSYYDRLNYVKYELRLRFLGEGSSRAAFVLDSKRALKLAINAKGRAQNEAELDIASDPKVNVMYAKILTYDPEFRWLVSELVKPLSDEKEFQALTGVDYNFFFKIAWQSQRTKGDLEEIIRSYQKFNKLDPNSLTRMLNSPWFQKTIHALRQTELLGGDLHLEHWGKTPDQRVVLLDYGFTRAVRDQFY